MAGHECFHCKQWVEEGEEHDCWTTTEATLTADLSEDLREAWERQGLLLLCAAEGEVSRAVDHARPADQGAASAERDEGIDKEVRQLDPRHAP